MAIIFFNGSGSLTVDEDGATLEMKIRKAREDRTSFVELTIEGGASMTWVNADLILRFMEH